MIPQHSAHDEPMTGQTVCFTLIYFTFLSNNQRKYRNGHVFNNPRTFLIKHLILCEYPVSRKLLLNILYPNNFFLKYPVSRKPLVGPHSLRGHSVHFSRVERSLWSMSQCRPNPSFLSVFRIILTRACLEQNDPYSRHDCSRFLSF